MKNIILIITVIQFCTVSLTAQKLIPFQYQSQGKLYFLAK
jgi:hypothetical protein